MLLTSIISQLYICFPIISPLRYSPATIIETPRCFHGYQRLVPFRFEVSVRFQRSGTNTSLVSCARQSSRARPTRCTWLPWRKVPMGEKPNKLLDVSIFFFRPKNWVFGWILGGFLFLSNKCQGELDWTWAFHQRTTGSIYLCIYIYTHRN